MSSASPSSWSRSSVAGWVVAARGSFCNSLLSSNTTTGRPRRPKSQAHRSPTGPPPAINTWLSLDAIDSPAKHGLSSRHGGTPSPRRGEGWGEGDHDSRWFVTPHPTPLPSGEGAGRVGRSLVPWHIVNSCYFLLSS